MVQGLRDRRDRQVLLGTPAQVAHQEIRDLPERQEPLVQPVRLGRWGRQDLLGLSVPQVTRDRAALTDSLASKGPRVCRVT